MYRGSKEYKHLWIVEGAHKDKELEGFVWENLESTGNGTQLSDGGNGEGRIISFEQQGTYIAIWSDISCDALIEMAKSFVLASPRSI